MQVQREYFILLLGSIISEGGLLAKMFPPPAPEQCLIQVLIPDSEKHRLSEVAINSGRLDQLVRVRFLVFLVIKPFILKNFPLIQGSEESLGSQNTPTLEAICCICEKGVAEDIAQAALTAGAPGPTVTFGEGGGIRDKIPLLRMTKGPEKSLFGV